MGNTLRRGNSHHHRSSRHRH